VYLGEGDVILTLSYSAKDNKKKKRKKKEEEKRGKNKDKKKKEKGNNEEETEFYFKALVNVEVVEEDEQRLFKIIEKDLINSYRGFVRSFFKGDIVNVLSSKVRIDYHENFNVSEIMEVKEEPPLLLAVKEDLSYTMAKVKYKIKLRKQSYLALKKKYYGKELTKGQEKEIKRLLDNKKYEDIVEMFNLDAEDGEELEEKEASDKYKNAMLDREYCTFVIRKPNKEYDYSDNFLEEFKFGLEMRGWYVRVY